MEADTGMPLPAAQGGRRRQPATTSSCSSRRTSWIAPCAGPAIRETTALGAAYLAGLATGVWADQEELKQLWVCDTIYQPTADAETRAALMANWHKAVERCRGWAK